MRLESSIKQPILHPNYYGNTKKTRTDKHIHSWTHIRTHTLLPLNAHKRSKLINPLAAAVSKFSTREIKIYHNYDMLYQICSILNLIFWTKFQYIWYNIERCHKFYLIRRKSFDDVLLKLLFALFYPTWNENFVIRANSNFQSWFFWSWKYVHTVRN